MKLKDTGGPSPIDLAVGARIRLRRQEVGLSQQALAESLGVTFQQVQKYERGVNRISASMMVRAARALRCPTSAFLGDLHVDSPDREQEDALQAEINALLASPGAVDLLRAYAAIRDTEARNAVLAIVRGLGAGALRSLRGGG